MRPFGKICYRGLLMAGMQERQDSKEYFKKSILYVNRQTDALILTHTPFPLPCTHPQPKFLLDPIEFFSPLQFQWLTCLGHTPQGHMTCPEGGVTPLTRLPAAVDVEEESSGAECEDVSVRKGAGLAHFLGLLEGMTNLGLHDQTHKSPI